MAKKRKIDNLTPESSASEMEQAILEMEAGTNAPSAEPIVEEEKTIEPPTKEVVEVTEPIVPSAESKKEEVVEDSFDYKKAYDGLRSWQTKLSQQVSDTHKVLEQMAAQKQVQQPEVQQPQMTNEQYQDWYSRDPVAATQFVLQAEVDRRLKPIEERIKFQHGMINNILGESSINKVKSTYNDFEELRPEIMEELNNYPKEVQENPYYFNKLLDTTYWSVKGRKSKIEEERLREEGRKQAMAKANAKKETFVEGTTKPSQEQPLDLSSMKADEIYALMKARGIVKD